MTVSTASLRSLPPKQALALLLMEKAKRMKKLKDLQAARDRAAESDSRGEDGPPPFQHNATSLLFDPNHKL